MESFRFPDMKIVVEAGKQLIETELINRICAEMRLQLPNMGYSHKEISAQINIFLKECMALVAEEKDLEPLLSTICDVGE